MKYEILNTLKEHLLLIDGEYDRAEEIASLKKQINYIQEEIWRERNAEYVRQLKAFKGHMSDCFATLMDADTANESSMDDFYKSQFFIVWRGKRVRLENGAEVFQGIEDIIQNEIDNEEV